LRTSRQLIRAFAFVALLAFATLALLELGARLAFAWLEDWPSQASIQESLADVDVDVDADVESPEQTDQKPPKQRRGNVLHPYTGFVRNPLYVPKHIARQLPEAAVNEFGFFGPSPLTPKGDNVARVAITGGSVAEELFVYAGDVLAQELEASGAFGGRSVEVLLLGMAGFKQPQQLITVSYLLLLGADIDAVVNLDGFNEVVLPVTEIAPLNVAPSYPFRWNGLAINSIDAETAMAVARIGESLAKLESWRRVFSRFPLRYSAFALASWNALQNHLDAERIGLEVELRHKLAASLESRPGLRGPPAHFDSNDAITDAAVAIWKRASIQLWQLCQSHGVAYLHALQPNQYVPGSKPFSASERKVAILKSQNILRLSAEAGYRGMIANGPELQALGVPFLDLTGLFGQVEQPIYRDHCCHYHRLGYRLVASRIAEQLAETTR